LPIQLSPDVIKKTNRTLGFGYAAAAVFFVICTIAGEFYVQLFTTALRHSSILFLMGVGIMLVLRVNRIVNFAHGAFYVIGGYLAYSTQAFFGQSMFGYLLTAILAGLLVGGLGILIETILLRRIYQLPVVHQIIASAGIFLVLRHIIMAVSKQQVLISGPSIGTITILGIFISAYDLIVIAIGLIVLAGLYLLFTRTHWMAKQYPVEIVHNDDVSVHVNRRRFRTAVFFIATALAGFTGAAMGPLAGINPSAGIDILAGGFLVTLLSGLGSFFAAYLAALIIGFVGAFGSAFWGQSASHVIIFVVIAIVLTWWPSGLFSQTEPELQDTRQPLPPSKPDRRLLIATASVAILLFAFPAIGGARFISIMHTIFAYVLIGVSLHFLMRAEGIISLGHSAFAAIGGYSVAILTAKLGTPIVLAVPIGVVAAGLIGYLVAFPCVRLSPTSIAMLTFVLANTTYEALFLARTVTGGSNGLMVPVQWDLWQSYYITLFLCIMGLAIILYIPFSRVYVRLQDMTGKRSGLLTNTSRAFDKRPLSFAISGSIAGLAGSIFAIHWKYIFPYVASIEDSLTTLSVLVIGGIHSAFGPVLGAVAVIGTRQFLESFQNFWQVVIGAALIVLIVYYPKGISGIFEKFFGEKDPTIDRNK
jgi:branched-chain amino acid transport system permease protein